MKRAREALRFGILISLAVGIGMAYVSFFHGDIMSGIFAKNPEVIQASTEYLKAYSIDCMLVSVLFCMIGYFNGCGRTRL